METVFDLQDLIRDLTKIPPYLQDLVNPLKNEKLDEGLPLRVQLRHGDGVALRRYGLKGGV